MFQEAIPLFQQVRNLRTQALGPDHRDTLSSMRRLANLYRFVENIPDAIAPAEETLNRTR